jgi:hypothetical protein
MTRYLISKGLLWLISAALLFFCFSIVSNAQDTLKRPAHIGLIYPLSSNGTQAATVENGFSFHVLAGVSLQEDAFCLSGLSSIVTGNADGAIISGLYNHVGYDGHGFQLAGIANYNGHNFEGMQLSGISNIATDMNGIQIAGIVNIADSMTGLQLSGIVSIVRRADGTQLSGLANSAVTADVQVAGFVNIVQRSDGLQTAGFINVGDTVKSQIAGFINVAKQVKGIQLAGFINIADESDYPIGIVNIIKHGEKMLGVSMDETGTSFLTLRSGGRVLYGVLGIGYNFNKANARYAMEGGMGAHLPIGEYFRVNTELTFSSLADFKHDVYFKSTARIMAGLKLGNNIELFAGPSFNYLGFEQSQHDIRDSHYLWKDNKGSQFSGLFLGGTAGVQFRF